MQVKVSAPGKVILMGEHAVVYGKPALIAAIDKRLTVEVGPSSKITININEGKVYVNHIVENVIKHFSITKLPPVNIDITSEIPIGYHLGSSAAVAVGVTAALCFYLKKIWNLQLINQLAYESEKMIHVNSSGVDPATVTSGGVIWYRKELEFLRSIWQLPFQIPHALNNFYLIDTGRPKESTGEMVAQVSLYYKTHKLKYTQLFDTNELQVKRIATAIKLANVAELIDAIKIGEKTLEDMGVVSKKIIPLIRNIEKAGGSAKILGGGGNADGVGFLLGYHPDINILKQVVKSDNYEIQKIILGEPGVRLEK
jgi:mevalonate kinase